MKTTNQLHFRQGDVLIERIAALPAKLARLAPQNGRVVLAYGEVTGHHHSLVATPRVRQYAEPGVTNPVETGGVTYLEIAEALAELTHQEHATVPLEPGFYRVTRQREYSPEAIRNVQD